ncbi:MAG: site-specific integrase, partial [Paludibacteraceae bacterium]|nr:site-specific integrase [Paludibacteraceae bacterium]
VLLGTGMRVGEATGLRWRDIDFEEGMIDVNHTLVYYSNGNHRCKYAINDTKTPASKRLIPMTETVRKAFLMEKEMQEQLDVVCDTTIDGYTDFVFLNRFGGLHTQGTLNKVYKRIIRDCNDAEFLKSEDPPVLLPNFSSHNLRHTFATNCIAKGMQPKTLQKILGHTSFKTTMDLYCHVLDETIREEMNLVIEME